MLLFMEMRLLNLKHDNITKANPNKFQFVVIHVSSKPKDPWNIELLGRVSIASESNILFQIVS